MASKMTRDNFGKLLVVGHRKIFFDSYNEKPCQYKQVFKLDKMTKKQETYPHLGALGMWSEGHEGQVFNTMDFKEGATATFVAVRYDNSYEVTWELIQDDQYAVFRGKGLNGDAKSLGRGLRTREERNAADVILNGFTVAGYDGVPLFSKAHPLVNSTKTVSNLIEGELNDTNLKAALTLMRKQLDEAGIPIAARANQLVVHPDYEFTARTLVESLQTAGTNNNDKNTLPKLTVVVMDYLENDDGIKPWFIQDTSLDNLVFLTREEAIFRTERIPATMDWKFIGYKRFAEGYVDWRGLVGSTGVTTPIVDDNEEDTEEIIGQ